MALFQSESCDMKVLPLQTTVRLMQETRARSVGWVLIDFGTGFGVATSGINSAAEEYRPVLRSAANQFGL